MTDNRKKQLTDLGAEALPNALLELASFSDDAETLIDRMIATPAENQDRFKTKCNTSQIPQAGSA